ncbi:hypothetical protein GCM10009828_058510 [Actinoplanes couchii]
MAGATGSQVLRAAALETTLAVAIGSLPGGIAGVIAAGGAAVDREVPVRICWAVTGAAVLACPLFGVCCS